MKPKSVLQRMTLLGFMLMTMSINAFANNANEEKKNSTKVVVEKSVSRSILDPNVPIVLSVGEETGWLALPEFVGYECTSFELALSSDPDCVTVLVNDSLRSSNNIIIRFLKLIARAMGRAFLRLIYTPAGSDSGTSSTIEIEIEIRVSW